MNRFAFSQLAVTISVVLVGCAGSDQQHAQPSNLATPQAAPVVVEEYDLAKGTSAGLSYPLLTLDQMIKKIDALGGAQREFETDQAFAQRLTGLQPFTVCSEIVKPHVRFNAVTGEAAFEYNLYWDPSWSDSTGTRSSNEVYPSTRIGQKASDLGSSEAQNAYGAKAKVTTRKLDNVYLIFNPIPRRSLSDTYSPKLVGRAKQPLLDDLIASKKVEMCFEAAPIKPFVRYSYGGKKPTLDDPTATVATTRSVRVALTRFYIKGDRRQSEYVEDLRFSRW